MPETEWLSPSLKFKMGIEYNPETSCSRAPRGWGVVEMGAGDVACHLQSRGWMAEGGGISEKKGGMWLRCIVNK